MNSNPFNNPFAGLGYAIPGRKKTDREVIPDEPTDASDNVTSNELNVPRTPESEAVNYKAWREYFILSVLRIASVLSIVLIVLSLPAFTWPIGILYISAYIILLAVAFLPMQYSPRAFALLAIVYAIGLNALLTRGPFSDGSLILLSLVVFAALLFDTSVDIYAIGISIATFIVLAVLGVLNAFRPFSLDASIPAPKDWLIYIITYSIAGIVLTTAVRRFKYEFARVFEIMQNAIQQLNTENSGLGARVREQTEQLETKMTQLRSTTTIGRVVADIQDIPNLLDAVVHSIAEHFGYYHVGLYLLDDRRKNAFLQAASSIMGKQLVGQGFHAESDRQSAINIVAEDNRAYVASDMDGAAFIRDANFPLTQSRMVLPLSVRGEVFGVLDMQSDQPRAFTLDDAEVVQTLADLIAITMDNVRLINETKTLVSQLESYTSSQTIDIWSKFTSRHAPAYQYTPAGVRPIFSISKEEKSADENLQIPLILHGESIGKIKLRRKGVGETWSDKERELIEKIADQVALALENSRLVEEAQKSAQRDQVIANISSRVRETLDVESVVRTAATELRKVFDLKEAEISIGAPQSEPLRVRKNTSSLRLR